MEPFYPLLGACWKVFWELFQALNRHIKNNKGKCADFAHQSAQKGLEEYYSICGKKNSENITADKIASEDLTLAG